MAFKKCCIVLELKNEVRNGMIFKIGCHELSRAICYYNKLQRRHVRRLPLLYETA
jgi:hypothetical protein